MEIHSPILTAKPELETINLDPKLIFAPGEIGVTLAWELKNKDGKIIDRNEQKSRSFVKQFMQILHLCTANISGTPTIVGIGYRQVRTTSNVLQNDYNVTTPIGNWYGGIGIATYGLVIGTGVGAVAMTDYALGTLIAHGTGAGQLQYSTMSFGAPSASATICSFITSRDFANGSSGTVTPTEAGIYISRSNGYFLVIRDLIEAGVGVPIVAGNTIALHYKVQTTI